MKDWKYNLEVQILERSLKILKHLSQSSRLLDSSFHRSQSSANLYTQLN